MKPCILSIVAGGVVSGMLWTSPAWADEKVKPPTTIPATNPATQPIQAKPLTDQVKKGLDWLAKSQKDDGGWCQGDESANMGAAYEFKEKSNVGDTAVAALALMRAGSTPSEGEHAKHIRAALGFVCKQVENSDSNTLTLGDVKGTRLQAKLGGAIDTFAAALFLAESRDKITDEELSKRVATSLDRIIGKIKENQGKDGGFAKDGWANALCQNMASKAINGAAQKGAQVDEKMRQGVEQYAQGQQKAMDSMTMGGAAARPADKPADGFAAARVPDADSSTYSRKALMVTGTVATSGSVEGTAGVHLYGLSSTVNSMRQSDNTNKLREDDLRKAAEAPTTRPEEKEAAKAEIKRIEDNREKLAQAENEIIKKMEDKGFIAGFGSNGGEEFLSYLNIGESLVLRGGDEWTKWDKSMTDNLNRIQNGDGSWSGHHCITGRTFCTSAALMVLTVDRSTGPLMDKVKK